MSTPTAECPTCGQDVRLVAIASTSGPLYQIDDHTRSVRWRSVVMERPCAGTGRIVDPPKEQTP